MDKENLEKNLYLRIIKFGTKLPEGFTYEEIISNKKLSLNDGEKSIVDKYLDSAYLNSRQTKTFARSSNIETPFLLVGHPKGGTFQDNVNKYIINFDAHFKYIDYLELKYAREHAIEAKENSLSAIKIASRTLVVTIIGISLGFLFQYKSIESSNKNLQVSTDPQIEIFFKNEGKNEGGLDKLSLGVINVGTVDISDLTIKNFSASASTDCKNGFGTHGGGRSGDKWEKLNVGESVYTLLDNGWSFFGKPPELNFYVLYVEYSRLIDGRIYGQKVELAIDKRKIYWDEDIPTSDEVINARKCVEETLLGHDIPPENMIIKRPNI